MKGELYENLINSYFCVIATYVRMFYAAVFNIRSYKTIAKVILQNWLALSLKRLYLQQFRWGI